MSELVSATVANNVGFLRIDRPEKRNAINHELVDRFEEAVDRFIDGGVRVAVLSAEPPIFCAGADVDEALSDPGIAGTERLMLRLLTDEIFWIAKVEAPALGAGVAIVAGCPVALCTDSVMFSLPELRIGLFPSGVMAYLEPLIGTRRALTIGLTGSAVLADEAVRIGLATEAVNATELEERVAWWLAHLQEHPEIIDSARIAWQSTFAQEHIRSRKTEFDRLIEVGRAAL